ncbi:MAG TPA: ABC transporter permease [Actinomycetota bacterium]|nr:ABC transporter permease [Actinomycetota bacterium]
MVDLGVSKAPAVAGRRPSGVARREWMQEVAALTRRWYLQLVRDRLNLVFSLTQPAFWLIFFGGAMGRAVDTDVIGTTNYVGFMLAGIIAFTVVTNAMTGAMPLLWDKETGYLDKLLSMPMARSSLIVSRFLFQFGVGTAQVLLVFLVAVATAVDIAAGPLGALTILVVAGLLSMSFSAIFTALAFRVPTHGTFFAITGFVTLPLVFMSNAFVPIEAMPDWMAAFARANPLSYAVDAVRTLILDGWAPGVAGSMAILAAFAGICLGLATFEFRRHTGLRVD